MCSLTNNEFDCPSIILMEERGLILCPDDRLKWFLIRLDLVCPEDFGKFLIRQGHSLLSLSKPIRFNSSVMLNHRGDSAYGSVCDMSEDRCLLEKQLKILEAQENYSAAHNSRIDTNTQSRSAPNLDIKQENGVNKIPRPENVVPENRCDTLSVAFQDERVSSDSPVVPEEQRNIMVLEEQSHCVSSQFENNMNTKMRVVFIEGKVNCLKKTVTDMEARIATIQPILGIDNISPDTNYNGRETIFSDCASNSTSNASRVLSEVNGGANDLLALKANASLNENKNASHSRESKVGAENSDMLPIGSGNTLVPKNVYNNINWTSYTIATRKLLMAVFSRRTLATHSLTGKPSPAFVNKPAKLQLDMKKVMDIVMTVVDNCGVREGLVRSCITTKCADENKMYRMRLQKKENKSRYATEIATEGSENQKNISSRPVSNSDEEATSGPNQVGRKA